MKKAILTLSILGGVTGLLSIFSFFFGSAFLAVLGVNISANQVVARSFAVIGFSILGIIGGAIARKGLKISSLPLFIACFGGLIASYAIPFILPAIFFFIGGILALFVKK